MTALASGATVVRRAKSVEWPSLVLCFSIYAAFVALTVLHDRLSTAMVVAAGALLVTVQSSLQHEFIHGHPTPSRRLNRALASVPLSLWLPFESYRRSHLIHHQDEQLTDPLDDPESYYWTAAQWQALSRSARRVIVIHSTLAGRLLLGPAVTIGRFLATELRALRTGDRQRRMIWIRHGLAVAALGVWIVGICGINPLLYLAIIYAGTSLLLLRSFAEHRANDGVFERSAIVENSWLLGPLYLFNNLHAAHHERPLMPWYALPAWYRANRGRIVADNGGLVYDGYGEVVRRFLFKPHHVVVHPRFGTAV